MVVWTVDRFFAIKSTIINKYSSTEENHVYDKIVPIICELLAENNEINEFISLFDEDKIREVMRETLYSLIESYKYIVEEIQNSDECDDLYRREIKIIFKSAIDIYFSTYKRVTNREIARNIISKFLTANLDRSLLISDVRSFLDKEYEYVKYGYQSIDNIEKGEGGFNVTFGYYTNEDEDENGEKHYVRKSIKKFVKDEHVGLFKYVNSGNRMWNLVSKATVECILPPKSESNYTIDNIKKVKYYSTYTEISPPDYDISIEFNDEKRISFYVSGENVLYFYYYFELNPNLDNLPRLFFDAHM